MDSPVSHRRPAAPLPWRLWRGLRHTLAAAWPGWATAARIAVLLALVALRILGWMH